MRRPISNYIHTWGNNIQWIEFQFRLRHRFANNAWIWTIAIITASTANDGSILGRNWWGGLVGFAITIDFFGITTCTVPSRVIKVDWTIRDIAIPIPTLRIGRIGNHRIRLQKVVNIRRI